MRLSDSLDGQPCPRAPDLPALLQGECSTAEEASLVGHLAECSSCRDELASLSSLIEALRAAPPFPSHPNLAPSILAALPAGAAPPPRAHGMRAATALAGMASAAAVLGALLLALPERSVAPRAQAASDSLSAALERGFHWLIGQQHSDGSWAIPDATAHPAQRSGLSGLCLAALSQADLGRPKIRRSVDRAAHVLQSLQSAGGRMGPPGPTGFASHAIATWGLLELYERRPWPGLKPCLAKALRHLTAMQDEDGGWCRSCSIPAAEKQRTGLWALAALRRAEWAGWMGLASAISRAERRYVLEPSGAVGTAGDAALAQALMSAVGLGQGNPKHLATRVMRRQVRRGPLAGSWASSAGRVQETACNLLVLLFQGSSRSLVSRAR